MWENRRPGTCGCDFKSHSWTYKQETLAHNLLQLWIKWPVRYNNSRRGFWLIRLCRTLQEAEVGEGAGWNAVEDSMGGSAVWKPQQIPQARWQPPHSFPGIFHSTPLSSYLVGGFALIPFPAGFSLPSILTTFWLLVFITTVTLNSKFVHTTLFFFFFGLLSDWLEKPPFFKKDLQPPV